MMACQVEQSSERQTREITSEVLSGNCQGDCDGQSANGTCRCDSECYAYNDCCEDLGSQCTQHCPTPTPSRCTNGKPTFDNFGCIDAYICPTDSCENNCSETSRDGSCSCDTDCQENGNCCSDFQNFCPELVAVSPPDPTQEQNSYKPFNIGSRCEDPISGNILTISPEGIPSLFSASGKSIRKSIPLIDILESAANPRDVEIQDKQCAFWNGKFFVLQRRILQIPNQPKQYQWSLQRFSSSDGQEEAEPSSWQAYTYHSDFQDNPITGPYIESVKSSGLQEYILLEEKGQSTYSISMTKPTISANQPIPSPPHLIAPSSCVDPVSGNSMTIHSKRHESTWNPDKESPVDIEYGVTIQDKDSRFLLTDMFHKFYEKDSLTPKQPFSNPQYNASCYARDGKFFILHTLLYHSPVGSSRGWDVIRYDARTAEQETQKTVGSKQSCGLGNPNMGDGFQSFSQLSSNGFTVSSENPIYNDRKTRSIGRNYCKVKVSFETSGPLAYSTQKESRSDFW